jgi:hypothetical protein
MGFNYQRRIGKLDCLRFSSNWQFCSASQMYGNDVVEINGFQYFNIFLTGCFSAKK